ncbi:type II toxin-antitoxin system MqsA family antitoxin [Cupriavidus gilardii]|uniref:type II toxin-antitoxin system MqsA family antitoxin n=1 Tax=Cupriavidus gilardii TaxID=82541 RepID=UPI001ABDAA9F|nr:type II toxin-antitoxin system MqsA family antitoxin [Cupriavidus gilardii]
MPFTTMHPFLKLEERKMRCPICAAGELLNDVRDLTFTLNGKSIVVQSVRGDFCPACGEGILDGVEASRVSAAIVPPASAESNCARTPPATRGACARTRR